MFCFAPAFKTKFALWAKPCLIRSNVKEHRIALKAIYVNGLLQVYYPTMFMTVFIGLTGSVPKCITVIKPYKCRKIQM